MSFWQEFKKFAVKGNMLDLAIAVVLGTAFNAIITSLVKNIITPPLGVLTSGVDVADMKYPLRPEVVGVDGEITREAVFLEYGLFLEALINFGLIAVSLFVVVKFINHLKESAEDPKDDSVPTPPPPQDIVLLTEIRDQLEKMNATPTAAKAKPAAKTKAKTATKSKVKK